MHSLRLCRNSWKPDDFGWFLWIRFCDFRFKKTQKTGQWVYKSEKVIIMGGIMNYENIALFLKSHEGGDDNCESTWPGLIFKREYSGFYNHSNRKWHSPREVCWGEEKCIVMVGVKLWIVHGPKLVKTACTGLYSSPQCHTAIHPATPPSPRGP